MIWLKVFQNSVFKKIEFVKLPNLENKSKLLSKARKTFLLQLLHIDLFGPSRYTSLNGKYYAFVIADDYSRYTWVLFLSNKDDAFDAFKVFCKKVQNEKGCSISCIRSDHGGEFEKYAFENFCNDFGIEHQFSSPRTPQQNRLVERKNRSIQEIARTMLNENFLPKYF